MHKGVPWRLQLSLSAQTPSSFTTMPALFPVALATLRPARPLYLSLWIHRDFCSCPEAAEEGLTKVVQRKRVNDCLFLLSAIRHFPDRKQKSSSTQTELSLFKYMWYENPNPKVKCC